MEYVSEAPRGTALITSCGADSAGAADGEFGQFVRSLGWPVERCDHVGFAGPPVAGCVRAQRARARGIGG